MTQSFVRVDESELRSRTSGLGPDIDPKLNPRGMVAQLVLFLDQSGNGSLDREEIKAGRARARSRA